MDYKISRELFEEVCPEYKKYKYHDRKYEFEQNRISISLDGQSHFGSVSYNDFFFKCKEWALKNNYSILSYTTKGGGKAEPYLKSKEAIKNKTFKANSEQQAVFDSCQWILEDNNAKD